MRIGRVDPADGEVIRACHAVHVAAQAVDDTQDEPPFSLALFAAWLAHGWACDPCQERLSQHHIVQAASERSEGLGTGL